MHRQNAYVSEEEASEYEPSVGPVMRPKLSRRAAMVSRADEQVLRSLREAIYTENSASFELDDLRDEFEVMVERAREAEQPSVALARRASEEMVVAQPRSRHDVRAAQRQRAREAPRREGALVYGVRLGRHLGEVVDLATRMYGDTDAPDLPAIVNFADAALRDPNLLQSPEVRKGVTEVRNGVKAAFDLVFAVVDEIATASEEQLARSDAGLLKLCDARQLLVAAEYTLTWLLSTYAPTERQEHERSEVGLEVFETAEAERMKPMWRRSYGQPGEYLRNAAVAPSLDDEERVAGQAQEVANRNGVKATVGRLWLADGGYRWTFRFDDRPLSFDDGSRFEPVRDVLPIAEA